MFKQLTALIFLFSFAHQTFNKEFIVFDYLVNTSTYKKDCINKAKPQLHCNGKCQMMKKLLAEEKKEQEKSNQKEEAKFKITLSSKSFYPSYIKPLFAFHKNNYPHISSGKIVKRNSTLFKPPCC